MWDRKLRNTMTGYPIRSVLLALLIGSSSILIASVEGIPICSYPKIIPVHFVIWYTRELPGIALVNSAISHIFRIRTWKCNIWNQPTRKILFVSASKSCSTDADCAQTRACKDQECTRASCGSKCGENLTCVLKNHKGTCLPLCKVTCSDNSRCDHFRNFFWQFYDPF